MPDLTNTPTVIVIVAGILLQPVAVLIGWLAVRRRGSIGEEPQSTPVAVPDDLSALAATVGVDPRPTYGPCGDAYPLEHLGDGYTCDRPKGHPGLHGEGALAWESTGDLFLDHGHQDSDLVTVGKREVHRGCRDNRSNGRPVRACCRLNLDKVTEEVAW
jgi:hypothetical protein